MRNWKAFVFITILSLTLFIRIVHLGTFPPSISWDEASVGYNAYSVFTSGRDEWGKFSPLAFKSFREFKHPVHIYLTIPFIALFGLNEWSTRLPSALFGVAFVYLMYVLGKRIFKREMYGLILASVIAISPYAIQFSRFNHELSIAVFLFFLGLYLFLRGLDNFKWLWASALFFGLTLITYNSAKIVVPLFLILLSAVYFKELRKLGKKLIQPGLIFGIFLVLVISYPGLLGSERAKQSVFSRGDIENTKVYKKTNSLALGYLTLVGNNYLSHFSQNYLFVSGDSNLRHSTQSVGEFYKLDLLFLVAGIFGLIKYALKHNSKEVLLIFLLVLIAPIPASIVNEAPHAARAMFMVGSMHMIISYGIFSVFDYFKNKEVGMAFLLTIFTFYLFFFVRFINYYFIIYADKSAIEWQYGMKQVVDFVANNNKKYTKVYVTRERGQPYIFFLYYLKYPVDKLLETVMYDTTPASSFNTISSFENGKYNFGNWDIVHSIPIDGYLYVLTPFEYSGLASKNDFVVKKVIKYPDGADAYYIVSSY